MIRADEKGPAQTMLETSEWLTWQEEGDNLKEPPGNNICKNDTNCCINLYVDWSASVQEIGKGNVRVHNPSGI